MAEKDKKFDPKRAHGIVYNHLSAKYEQDGVLFGANGLPVKSAQLEEDERKLEEEVRAEVIRRKAELAAKNA